MPRGSDEEERVAIFQRLTELSVEDDSTSWSRNLLYSTFHTQCEWPFTTFNGS
jgi:hypothetical protein